ncbi:DNA polymerase III subunit delta [Sphingomonas sp. RHCKR47]|uniref:DNA polymerase III subunit delta n=1 Tax=Sphingomonas citricola TaxID=2862498 RepID=UPI001CA547D8|nr:DNA polymerase III subunit delta [Sphingomonas citricola]MBW6524232.1 DNA polymerase III subunit delta [Sphingomonas citricola]
MKATQAQLTAALDRGGGDIRLFLLHGPDESGALAFATRLARSMGEAAERVDLDAASLRNDPAKLADEAASLSLFGERRFVRVVGAGEESADAVEALLEAPSAGNPVVMIAPSVKATGRLVKIALAGDRAMSFACYPPEGNNAEALVTTMAREQGLRLGAGVAARIVRAGDGDRAIMASEVDKLALYLDAGVEHPRDAGMSDLAEIGAELDEGEITPIVEAVIAGDASALIAALRPMEGADASPIPWLRALARRLASLAEMRAAVDAGEGAGQVVKRFRVFWREEGATIAALQRWSVQRLMRALEIVRATEREVMARGAAGRTIADHQLLTLARRR